MFINKNFTLLLVAISFSFIGDTFQLIATTTKIVAITGSGLAAGFAVLFAPIPSILLSQAAGIAGDRISPKTMIFIISIARTITAFFYISAGNSVEIYILMFFNSCLGVLASPSYRKLMVHIVPENKLVRSNSILSGLGGIAFLIGPALSGFLCEKIGTSPVFLMSFVLYSIFSILILFVGFDDAAEKLARVKQKLHRTTLVSEFTGVFRYVMKEPRLVDIIIIETLICMGSASMNFSFYPFIFNDIGASSSQWGIMLSFFYGSNLLATFLTMRMENFNYDSMKIFIFVPLVFVALTWCLYSFANSMQMVIALQILEGAASALIGIFLATLLQVIPKKDHVARVNGFNDMLNSISRLAGIGITLLLLRLYKPQLLFALNGLLLMTFAASRILKKNDSFDLQHTQ